jgi:hypothetical protein
VKLVAGPAALPEPPAERVATPVAPRLKGSTTADAQPAGWSTMVDASPSRR